MKRYCFIICFLLATIAVHAQDYEITFNAVGESSFLDSVLVQNITQNTELTMPGDAVLHLVGVVSGVSLTSVQGSLSIYPNPFTETAIIEFYTDKSSKAGLEIFDVSGKLVTNIAKSVQKGKQKFEIKGLSAGAYSVVLTTDNWQNTAKLISIGAKSSNPEIVYMGYEDVDEVKIKHKSSTNLIEMQYNDDDVLVFTGYSGVNAAVSTLIPTQSQLVTENVVSCVDPDGYSYSTVTIADQIWMAENLRYLPEVSPHNESSSAEPHYYVYNYDGANIEAAQSTEEYNVYGVLYNRPAALVSCPDGWHLPSHLDWVELERAVCVSPDCENDFPYSFEGSSTSGTIEGSILAGDQDLWYSDYYIAGIYNEPLFSTSGFLAKPAGYSMVINEGYFDKGVVANYWASDVEGANGFIRFMHICNTNIFRDVNNGSLGNSVRCVRNLDDEVVIPTVCTQIITALTATSAVSGGVVTNNGLAEIESQGIVWNTSPNPSIDNNLGYTDNGSVAGDFVSEMNNLTPNTIYYVRAYAINSAGTGYGEQIVFETLPVSSGNNGQPCSEIPSVYYQGYLYHTIQFGSRCWLAENLKYLPSVTSDSQHSETLPLYYVYGYSGTNVSEAQSASNYDTYGVLYNYQAALSACPNGWYLPYNNDWTDLEREVCISGNCDSDFLYGDGNFYSYEGTFEGSRLAGNNDLWLANELTNNSEFGLSGFDALPGGAMMLVDESNNFAFANLLCQGSFWSATEKEEWSSWMRTIICYQTGVGKIVSFKDEGLSVRCIKAEIPKISTNVVLNISHHVAGSGAEIVSDCGSDIIHKGLVWSPTSNPTIGQNMGSTNEGSGSDSFESTINGLEAETTYYVRAYATNSIGTGYGEERTFTTAEISIPIIETDTVSTITYISAICGGTVVTDGGVNLLSVGLVWDTIPFPTIEVNSGVYFADESESTFTNYLEDLDYSRTYYVRAFATNSIGVGYGNEISFTTDDFFPYINCGDNFFYGNYYYKTVQIGNQCWFAENMRYDNGCSQIAWVNNTDVGQCSFIDDNEEEFGHVGMFYQWSVAKDICPSGWHLPSDAEWTALDDYVSSQEEYWCYYGGGGYVKALVDSVGWNYSSYSCNVGNEPSLNNATGFTAIPTSYYLTNLTGENTLFWTSTSGTNSASDKSYKWEIQYDLHFMTHAVLYKYSKLSVRCLKTELSEIHTSAVSIISETTATIECNVVSEGGESVTARGCVWSMSSNPTISNNDGITIDGSGLGNFSSVIKWLTPNTEYYVRAYATNSAGTAYGEELVFTTKSLNSPCPGLESIFYQGHSYNTVQIGSQCWFAENLRYLPAVNSLTSTSTTVPYYYVYMYNGTDFSEATLTTEYNNFGVLYNWTAAKTACPDGWSLPSHYDWTVLERSISTSETSTTDFPYYNQTEQYGLRGYNEGSKIVDPELWTPADLTDTYDAGISNFNALPAGAKLASSFLVQNGGEQAYWWSSTQSSTSNAWYRSLDFLYPGIYRNTSSKAYAYSVRCVKTNDVYGILPSVITHDVENLTTISAKLIAEVESPGQSVVGSRGILWGTNPQMDYDTYQNRVLVDTGLGEYFLQLNTLSPGVTYYFRAFAMNDLGIGYSEAVEFTTLELPEAQPCSETPTVDYEGYSYKTVKIGNQCWFAENLKYLPNVIENSTISLTIPYCYVFGYNGTDVNEAVLTDNYNTYGVLYNWAAVMNGESGSANNPSNVKGICPNGWHLPSKLEFEQLTSYLINNGYAYNGIVGQTGIAKSMSDTLLWNSSTSNGAIGNNLLTNNSSGFSVIPSGLIFSGYSSIPYTANFWTSTVQGTSTYSYELALHYNANNSGTNAYPKSAANSVRCIRDFVTPEVSTIGVSQVSYTTAVIDGQVISGGELPVLARGIVWSCTSNPTLAVSEGFSVNGIGIGEFSGQMYHLISDTLYYVRTYARNSADTIYGEEITVETPAFPNCGNVDYQGYSYKTVIIGERCWLAENMRYLPTVVPPSSSSYSVPYYYVYGYNGTNVADAKATSNYQNYGVLYNWIAAAMVCPPGWNLPNHNDWTYLERTICGGIENNSIFPFSNSSTGTNMTNNAGSSIAGGSTMWTDGALENNPLFGASGFNALPGGKLEYSNYFTMINTFAFFWTNSDQANSHYWFRWISYQDSSINRSYNSANLGYSVRCVQSAVLPDVETVSASEISDTSANISLNIISDGGMYVSLYGLVWDTVPNPTLENCHDFIQLNGPAIGMKEIHLNNLIPDKTIYIKSYAINSIGTSYGNEINIVTLSPSEFTQCGDDVFYIDQYYHTVQIGEQCWFAENLRYLPSVISVDENSSTEPLYYIFGYNGTSTCEAKHQLHSSRNIYQLYGVLYNWIAVMNGDSPAIPESDGVQGICPAGWLVPSRKSWLDLENYLVETGFDCPWDDYENSIAKSLTDSLFLYGAGSDVCSPGNTAMPNNETGFSAMPGGSTGNADIGSSGYWWTSDEFSGILAHRVQISRNYTTIQYVMHNKYYGNSVRCVME